MGAFARRLRKAGAITGAGLLVAGLAVGPAAASSIRLVDASGFGSGGYGYSNGYGQGGSGYGQGGEGYGSSGGSGSYGSQGGSPTTTNSQEATDSESKGVVLIDTELYDGSEAAGTGIVLTANGEVLTNYHVVEGSTSVKVTVATTGKTYSATVVGADKTSDVAVLRLKNASGLGTATIDNDTVSVGDDVTAVGNAGGTGTLTAADGDVTSLGAKITTEAEGSVSSETLTGLIETDADVVPGDSGGPLIDDEGEVVGIDTAASSGSEVDGYAIPIDNALKIVNKINSGDETSQVRIGAAAYLGVEVSESSTGSEESGEQNGYGNSYGYGYGSGAYGSGYGDQYGGQDGSGLNGSISGNGSISSVSGAAVVGVEADTPAAEAGLAAGDVITNVGSTTIGSADALTSALSGYQPGDQVKISWTTSSGAEQSATITLGSSPIN